MGRERDLVRDALMWGAASWSMCGVAAGPPVITKLLLAVHLMVTSWTCGGVMVASFLLRAEHSISGLIWPSWPNPSLARSTNKLGLGGLALAIAEKVRVGVWCGADDFCLLLPTLVPLLEGGGGTLFKASTALDSYMRESWIFCSSRFGEGLTGAGAGASL